MINSLVHIFVYICLLFAVLNFLRVIRELKARVKWYQNELAKYMAEADVYYRWLDDNGWRYHIPQEELDAILNRVRKIHYPMDNSTDAQS